MADDEGHWLDIQVHKRTHDALKRWGRRAGVTPEGYAKMLLTYAMHPLLAAEAANRAVQFDAQQPEQRPPDDDGALSTQLWHAALDSYRHDQDEMPAPRMVNGNTRVYSADDFRWPEGRPSWPWCHVSGNEFGVSRSSDKVP